MEAAFLPAFLSSMTIPAAPAGRWTAQLHGDRLISDGLQFIVYPLFFALPHDRASSIGKPSGRQISHARASPRTLSTTVARLAASPVFRMALADALPGSIRVIAGSNLPAHRSTG
jgi:hypothetical protein